MEFCSSQPFLAKLQPLIKEENTTVVGEIEKTETGNKNEVNAKFPISDLQEEEKHKDCDLGDVKKTQIHYDPEVVQIKAGKAEVRRFYLGGGYYFKSYAQTVKTCILIVYRLTDEYLHLLKESKPKSMKTTSGNFAMLLIVIKVTTWKKLIFIGF